MSFSARITLFLLGLIFFLIIFEMVRRKKFREELSVTWFIVGFALMASSVADKIVDPIARVLGIGYPPALVFVWIIFFLVLALIYFSYVISDLKGKVKELSQKIALLEYEVDKNKDEG
ncbi:MAG TPA: DUF2304 domain-containing protein [Thermodesulfovibrionales bacterium]|jgi:hypothetical protein|nr:DUF2304 domain-containing protein [Thermodesulfovibrionales bacterium]